MGTKLANNVLEELLHNPRFSMYGIHAKNIADTIFKEMNLDKVSSFDQEQSPKSIPSTEQKVEQFALPSPQRAVSLQRNQNEYGQNYNNTENKQKKPFSFNNNKTTEHEMYYQSQQNNKKTQSIESNQSNHSTDSFPPNGPKPGHKPHSASVVLHENIRDSEI